MIQLRLEKGVKNKDGSYIFSANLPPDEAIEKGVITPAPPYSEGEYSTHYYPKHSIEDKIFKHKNVRKYPEIETIMIYVRDELIKNK